MLLYRRHGVVLKNCGEREDNRKETHAVCMLLPANIFEVVVVVGACGVCVCVVGRRGSSKLRTESKLINTTCAHASHTDT